MATPQHDHTTRPQHITPLYFTTFLHVVGNPAVYRPVWLMDYYTPSLLLQQLGAVKLSQTSHPWQKEEGTLSLVTSLWKCMFIDPCETITGVHDFENYTSVSGCSPLSFAIRYWSKSCNIFRNTSWSVICIQSIQVNVPQMIALFSNGSTD